MCFHRYVAAILLTVPLLISTFPGQSHATPEFAEKTGQQCVVCHISSSGGGSLTPSGEAYLENPASWTPPAVTSGQVSLVKKIIHLILIYLHITFGVVWIGTILYVHIVLKPKYALGGLPRSELKLAWVSMPVIGVSGTLLTVWRVKNTPGLWSSMFGELLLAKIVVFSLMVFSATFVTLFIGPRLRKLVHNRKAATLTPGSRTFTLDNLKAFDGKGGAGSMIAVNGEVWDVSKSPLWRGGTHAMRHSAGEDLTDSLKNAPHKADVLKKYERAGVIEEGSEQVPAIVRIFTINAHLNLAGCFLILLILALWHW